MSEMIERVARALYDEDPVVIGMLPVDDIRALARAAIAPMREPTVEMRIAGFKAAAAFLASVQKVKAELGGTPAIDNEDFTEAWRAMVDAALSDKTCEP